ncbi:replication factor RFC1 C terminal domain-containing protein [Phlyctema vagabunda]|uniref:Replication factor RFC1 C terminal domain-containing protein n=1 Tax=Phlyctema vagabunda TaxID=108571 RepID=A0ABR4PRV8_9HELO
MPPKRAAPASAASGAPSSAVWVVLDADTVDSVHASLASAKSRQDALDSDEVSIVDKQLEGGSITVSAAAPEKKEKVSKPAAAPAKTKTPAEQRAANAEKPSKPKGDVEVPDHIQALLDGQGTVLEGKQICVTGVPPTLGRKHAETLVTAYGGKLMKSLSKNTTFVVVGNEAGPKKLEQIEGLGLQVYDEDAFIAMLEDDNEKPKAKKAKK